MEVFDPALPGIPELITSIADLPVPTKGLLKFLSKKKDNFVFSRVPSDVSISRVSPIVREIGGFTELPILTNLVPGSYTAVTELVPDDTTVRSI